MHSLKINANLVFSNTILRNETRDINYKNQHFSTSDRCSLSLESKRSDIQKYMICPTSVGRIELRVCSWWSQFSTMDSNVRRANHVSGLEKWDCSGCYMQSFRTIKSPSRICPGCSQNAAPMVSILYSKVDIFHFQDETFQLSPRICNQFTSWKIYERLKFFIQ